MVFFRSIRHMGQEILEPLRAAGGGWGANQMRGPAITAVLAREVERTAADFGSFLPARSTFDLHTPAPMRRCHTRGRVVKQGRRLRLVEAELVSGERIVARCRTILLAPSQSSEKVSVTPSHRAQAKSGAEGFSAPGPELRAQADISRVFRSEATSWTGSSSGHTDKSRQSVWLYDDPILPGEALTAFQHAASAADLSNYAVNRDDEGLSFINADVTLALVRLPEGDGVGSRCASRLEENGLSVGTATLFDRQGAIGHSSLTGLLHGKVRFNYE